MNRSHKKHRPGQRSEFSPGVSLAIRLLAALPLIALGVILLRQAGGGLLHGFGFALFSMACFVGAALAVAPGLAGILARPMGGILFPDAPLEHPPANFGPADAAHHSGRLEEALQKYAAIMESHPEAFRAYAASLRITLVELGDEERAREILNRGLAGVRREEERAELLRLYGEYRDEGRARRTNGRRKRVKPEE